VALNAARAIAYWPQIVSIYRDPGRASAVSLWTDHIHYSQRGDGDLCPCSTEARQDAFDELGFVGPIP